MKLCLLIHMLSQLVPRRAEEGVHRFACQQVENCIADEATCRCTIVCGYVVLVVFDDRVRRRVEPIDRVLYWNSSILLAVVVFKYGSPVSQASEEVVGMHYDLVLQLHVGGHCARRHQIV